MSQPTPRHNVPAGDGIQVPTVAAPIDARATPHQSDSVVFPVDPTQDTGKPPEPGSVAQEFRADEMEIARDAFHGETPLAILDAGNWMDRVEGALDAIRLMLAKEIEQPDEDEWITLTTREYSMRRRGRRYLSVFSPVAITGLLFSVQGTAFVYNFAAGWNPLNLPEGSVVAMPTGSQIMLVRWSNWFTGSAI